MSYAKILLDICDGIATITLHRPEAYNALDMQLATELHDAVVTCSEDAAVRVVVVTGSGRAFCAGGDVKGFVSSSTPSGSTLNCSRWPCMRRCHAWCVYPNRPLRR